MKRLKEKEENQEEAATMGCKQWLPLKEISADVAGAAVLSQPDAIFTFKDQQKNDTEGFSQQATWFRFSPDRLESLVKHCS